MGDKRDKDNPYRIDEAELGLHKIIKKPDEKAFTLKSIETRVVKVSASRVVMFCVLPFIPAALLIWSAVRYYRIIPEGDPTMRYFAVGICAAFAGLLISGSSYLYLKYSQKTITLEQKRLVVREADSLLAVGWSEVTIDPVKGGLVKMCVFHLAGRRRWIDSVFFPDFNEAVEGISDRVKAAHVALNETSTHVL